MLPNSIAQARKARQAFELGTIPGHQALAVTMYARVNARRVTKHTSIGGLCSCPAGEPRLADPALNPSLKPQSVAPARPASSRPALRLRCPFCLCAAEQGLVDNPPEPLPLSTLTDALASHYCVGASRSHDLWWQAAALSSLLPLLSSSARHALFQRPLLSQDTGTAHQNVQADIWRMLEGVRRAINCLAFETTDSAPCDSFSVKQCREVSQELQHMAASLLLPSAGIWANSSKLRAAAAMIYESSESAALHAPTLHAIVALQLPHSFVLLGEQALQQYQQERDDRDRQAQARHLKAQAAGTQYHEDSSEGGLDLLRSLSNALVSALEGLVAIAWPILAAGAAERPAQRSSLLNVPLSLMALLSTPLLPHLLSDINTLCTQQLLPMAAPLLEMLAAHAQLSSGGGGGSGGGSGGAAAPGVPARSAAALAASRGTSKKEERQRKEKERREAAEAEAKLQQQLAAAAAALQLLQSVLGCVEVLVQAACVAASTCFASLSTQVNDTPLVAMLGVICCRYASWYRLSSRHPPSVSHLRPTMMLHTRARLKDMVLRPGATSLQDANCRKAVITPHRQLAGKVLGTGGSIVQVC